MVSAVVLQIDETAFTWGHATHVGQRAVNEDAVRLPSPTTDGFPKGRLFAVADGMGGQRGGGLASRMACNALRGYYEHAMSVRLPWRNSDLRRQIEETMLRIDARIRRRGGCDATLVDMGTTLSCLVVTSTHTIVAHVGDSRIYRLRRGHLTRMTTDHTFVQDMIFEGAMDTAKARTHPLRHMLTRVVGTREPLEKVDTRIDPLRGGDRFLLCTDGLHDVLATERIMEALNQGAPARQIAANLVGAAIAAGGRDNVTALVIIHDQAESPGKD